MDFLKQLITQKRKQVEDIVIDNVKILDFI